MALLIWLTRFPNSLAVLADVLVPISAFRFADYATEGKAGQRLPN
ncbi:MAG TPA: hypothetical protein VMT73_05365 [Anaerolineales bacterium]|nr:hypothetical protein [Anaerolineales bacterium]